MNIYVGNLPFAASEDDLRQVFSQYGEVSSVSIIKDHVTGQSRGFGFVEMPDGEAGKAAIEALNGKPLKGRPLKINEARPKGEGGGFSGERRSSGGGYGDRGGDRRSNGGGYDRDRRGGSGGNRGSW